MKKLIYFAVGIGAVLTLLCFTAYFRSGITDDDKGTYAVELNEIQKLSEQGDNTQAAQKAQELRQELMLTQMLTQREPMILMVWAAAMLFLTGVTLYLWYTVLRPFHKLKDLAERMGAGDLDIPLEYERTNYFGKFTWAFDSMRREIIRSRECEHEAIENNKTVIASLSHDIKTPVASIRAYAEALELGMDGDPEKRSRYISTIIKKCDEVSKLTEDMFVHSLSDLDKLVMRPERFELVSFLEKTLTELDAGRGDIRFERPMYTLDINADKKRIEQLIGNLINNSRKYAKTLIEVGVKRSEDSAVIIFKDHGGGIPDEDMPFITGKFCRGSNCGDENGAGLGLYIVRYIAMQSGGDMKLKNSDGGLEVSITLPLLKTR